MSEKEATESKEINEFAVMSAIQRWIDKLETVDAKIRVTRYFAMRAESSLRPQLSVVEMTAPEKQDSLF